MKKMLARVLTAALIAALCAACSKKSVPLVTIDGKALSRAEVDFVLSTTVEQYVVMSGATIDWNGSIDGKPAAQYFRDQALELALSAHVTERRAGEMGVSLTEDEKAEIDALIAQEAEAAGGREEFEKQIRERYGGEDIYRYYYYTIPYLSQKLSELLFSQDGPLAPTSEKIAEFYAANYRCVSYVYITATDGEGQPLTGQERETQRRIAEVLRETAVSGQTRFEAIVEEHGMDYAMNENPGGFPVAVGVNGDSFDAAMLALSEGEISGVVEESGGFYIIKRMPDATQWLDENYEGVMYHYLSVAYTETVAEWRAGSAVETSEEYGKIDPRAYEPVG